MVSMSRLREEHEELAPWLQELLIAADRVGDAPFDTMREIVDEVYEFLVAHLIPHARAEDEVLYPAVERIIGAPGIMATMSRDHVEVARLTDELGRFREHLAVSTPGHIQEKGLRRVLYGLYALVRVHFAKEEEILVPILEGGLTEEEADRMFVTMGDVERQEHARGAERVHPGSRMLPV
jgi:iron-sulfur cluster repair protein YtfE (RIC family)